MTQLLNTYSKVFVVIVDNVGSQQMNMTRKQMRGKAEILMGKNTLMRKVLKDFLEEHPDHFHGSLDVKMKGNVGFVFTNYDLPKIRDLILANRVPAPARIGAFAPVDVIVPAGPTGCDPGQTSFFQVLQIPTKIVKGQIEITNQVNLIKKGEKVGSSEAALLAKLSIKPFSYGLGIDCIFDNGSMFSVDVLDIDEAQILSRFSSAMSSLAAVSLQIGYPTQASLPTPLEMHSSTWLPSLSTWTPTPSSKLSLTRPSWLTHLPSLLLLLQLLAVLLLPQSLLPLQLPQRRRKSMP